MKKKDRHFFCFLIALLSWMVLTTGCFGIKSSQPEPAGDNGKLKVVTTLFPYYDFVRQIAGEQVDLTLVVPAGMDSHSFEPTPADMMTIQNADILICNGGEMEHWLLQVLDAIDTSEITMITMMDYVEVFEEELAEGMEDGHEHEKVQGDDYIDHDGHEQEIEYDEHIWTSPVNAMKITEVIGQALMEEDAAHQTKYAENMAAYLEVLKGIDNDIRQIVTQGKRNMIVVGDKFPFRYLAEEYHLDYRAAFSGCSTDTEPSAKTIAYLIDKIREEGIPVIYYLELSSHRVSEIIGEETSAVPLLLHSCHNVTRREFDDGVTYVDLMKQNVENLRKGLDE